MRPRWRRYRPSDGTRSCWRSASAPWWLEKPASPWERKYEVRKATSVIATVSTLLALLLVAAVGLLRRRAELWACALIALVLCVGLAAVAAASPNTPLLSATLGYTMWFGSPPGCSSGCFSPGSQLTILAGRTVPGRPRPARAYVPLPGGRARRGGCGVVRARRRTHPGVSPAQHDLREPGPSDSCRTDGSPARSPRQRNLPLQNGGTLLDGATRDPNPLARYRHAARELVSARPPSLTTAWSTSRTATRAVSIAAVT